MNLDARPIPLPASPLEGGGDYLLAMISLITMKSLQKVWRCAVASLTIRNLEDNLKADLRVRAAQHGRSMEEEARQILRQVLAPALPPGSLSERIHRRFAALDADKLPVPARRPSRPPPRWDE